MILHDLRCRRCDSVERCVPVEFGKYGRCACGGTRIITWDGGKAPMNDLVKESVRFNRGLGIECATSREIDREARVRGWEPVADKLHGAERIPEFHPPERRRPDHRRRGGDHDAAPQWEEANA